jgi:hypothetical protein
MQDKSFFFHELKMGMICEIKLKSEFNSSAFDKKRSTVAAIISKSQTKLVWSSHKSTSPRRFTFYQSHFQYPAPMREKRWRQSHTFLFVFRFLACL